MKLHAIVLEKFLLESLLHTLSYKKLNKIICSKKLMSFHFKKLNFFYK